jgi:hypothetical protein
MFQPFQRGNSGRSNTKGIGLGLVISKSLVEKMGGTIVVESDVNRGSNFSFQLKFDLSPMSPSNAPLAEQEHTPSAAVDRKRMWSLTNQTDADSLAPLALNRLRSGSIPSAIASMMPRHSEVKYAFREESPLHFLVVDDNALNKSLFARTVDNMFKKLKREQTPVYTFASDGRQPFLPSVVQYFASLAVLDKIRMVSGLEAVEIFKNSLDDTIQGSTTKPQDFDCIFMVECASRYFLTLFYFNFGIQTHIDTTTKPVRTGKCP